MLFFLVQKKKKEKSFEKKKNLNVLEKKKHQAMVSSEIQFFVLLLQSLGKIQVNGNLSYN